MSKRAPFITFEGIEGAGKTTAQKLLASLLTQRGVATCLTREPGGTPIAEKIRALLLSDHDEKMASDTELLLMFSSRAQHLASLILPTLNAGKWVLCDRFTDASFAYQGGGRGIPFTRIEQLEEWVQGEFRPDVTILMDVQFEIGLKRIRSRSNLDRIENEAAEFFNNVRQAYLTRAQKNPDRYIVVDANVTPDKIESQLKCISDSLIERFLK